MDKLKDQLRHALLLVSVIMIPLAAMLVALAEPLVRVIYAHGQFGHDPYNTIATSRVLMLCGLSVWAPSAADCVASGFYSLKNTQHAGDHRRFRGHRQHRHEPAAVPAHRVSGVSTEPRDGTGRGLHSRLYPVPAQDRRTGRKAGVRADVQGCADVRSIGSYRASARSGRWPGWGITVR